MSSCCLCASRQISLHYQLLRRFHIPRFCAWKWPPVSYQCFTTTGSHRGVLMNRKANFVKYWNYENKKLFGPLIDTNTKTKLPNTIGGENLASSEEKSKRKRGRPRKKREKDTDIEDIIGGENLASSEEKPNRKRGRPGKNRENEEAIINGHAIPSELLKSINLQAEATPVTSVENLGLKNNSQTAINENPNLESIVLFPLFSDKESPLSPFPPETTKWETMFPNKMGNIPPFPGVSTVLDKTRSPENQFFLDRWKAKMIAELGEAGFAKYQQETFQKGHNLHACVFDYLEGKPGVERDLLPQNEGHWASLQHILPQVDQVHLQEKMVKHPYLHYKGIFDCVAQYRGQLCLIDWKTSQKQKPSIHNTFDNPLQVAAYVGALNFDEQFGIEIDNAAVVVAYEDGQPAHAHWLSREQCTYYWGQWLRRLHQYWTTVLQPGPR